MAITGYTESNESKKIDHTHPKKGRGGKATGHLTEDLSHYFVVDDQIGETVIKISFYGEKQMTPEAKIKVGNEMVRQYLIDRGEQREKEEAFRKGQRDYGYYARSSAFKDAYRLEDKTSKETVTWLLVEIMGMSREEAGRRFDIVNEVLSIDEFKDKEDNLVDKIYLNPDYDMDERIKNKYVHNF